MSKIVKGVSKGVKKLAKGVGDVVKGAAKVFKKIVTSKIFWAVVAVAAIAYGGYMLYSAQAATAAGSAASTAGTVAGQSAATGAIEAGAATTAGTAGSSAVTPTLGSIAAQGTGTVAPSAASLGSTAGSTAGAAGAGGAVNTGVSLAESMSNIIPQATSWVAPNVPAATTSLLESFVTGAKGVGAWMSENQLPTAVGMQMAGAALSPDEMDMQEQRQDWLEDERKRREENLSMVGINPGVRPNIRPPRPGDTLGDVSPFTPDVNTGRT